MVALYSQEVCTRFFVKPRNKGWLNINQSLVVCFSLFASSVPECPVPLTVFPLACLSTTTGARMNFVRGEADFSSLFASIVCDYVYVDSYDLLLRVFNPLILRWHCTYFPS